MPIVWKPVPDIRTANKRIRNSVDGGIRNNSPLGDVIQAIQDAPEKDVDYTIFIINFKVKNQSEIIAWIENLNLKDRTKTQKALLTADVESRTVHKVLENQFLRLFTSYAVVFNDRHQRDGNLFNRPFKRIEVENEGYFTYLIYYIHFNPQKHGVVSDFTSYYWSSYRIFLSSAPTHLFRKEVLEWFGGLEAFIQFHRMDEGFEKISGLIVEDE